MAKPTSSRAKMPAPLTPAERVRWTRVGALAAHAMALGYLETFVPLPIPGLKLGLANIPVLVALRDRDARGAWAIAAIKVLASGFLFGTPVSMAYSAAGTFLALLAMTPLSRLRTLRLELVSVVGALAHEAGQLLVAQALLGTPLVWYAAPPLLLAGCVTGFACGAVASGAMAGAGGSDETRDVPGADDDAGDVRPSRSAHPARALAAFVAFAALVLHLESPWGLSACLVACLACCAVAGVGVRDLARALRPVAAIAAVSIVAQAITSQASEASAWMVPAGMSVARLVTITSAGLALARWLGTEGFVKATEALARPLERLGVRTAGPTLALETALATLPQLAAGITDLPKGGQRWPDRLARLLNSVPPRE